MKMIDRCTINNCHLVSSAFEAPYADTCHFELYIVHKDSAGDSLNWSTTFRSEPLDDLDEPFNMGDLNKRAKIFVDSVRAALGDDMEVADDD